MTEIYLATGNKNKLKELQSILPQSINLKSYDLDLPEIQSINPEEIVADKLQRAFDVIKQPVIVEDVSAELACLNGLPGPFIKFFEKQLGKCALWQLAQHYEDRSAVIRCTMGYYDGNDMKIVDGQVSGTIVAPRGTDGWGFDFVFVPDGYTKTNAELGATRKNKISHRAVAAQKLAQQLSTN